MPSWCVARAAHSDEQVMREVRRLQLLALLRELAAARRCEHGDAGRVELLPRVEREVRRRRRALDARKRAALTRVEHDDGQRRVDREQALPQLCERQTLRTEIDRGRARVAGVIEEDPRLLAGYRIGGDTLGELIDRVTQLLRRRLQHDVDVLRLYATELGEQRADAPRV